MGYYETTYASSATPAVDVMNDMQTKMVANGWTLVETFTSGTDITDVYKSPAAGNSLGVDFFIYLNRTSTTATSVTVGISEQWDAVNKKAVKYNTSVTSAATPNQTDFTINDSGVVLNGSSGLNKIALFSVAISTARTFHINITPDRIMVCNVALGTTNGGYAGVYEPTSSHPAWAVCLGINLFTPSTGTTSAYGGTTRDPAVTTSTANCWRAAMYESSTAWINTGYNSGSSDPYGTTVVNRVGVRTRPTANPVLLLKDVIANSSGAANLAGGDTLALTYGATTLNYVSIPRTSGMSTTYSAWFPKQ